MQATHRDFFLSVCYCCMMAEGSSANESGCVMFSPQCCFCAITAEKEKRKDRVTDGLEKDARQQPAVLSHKSKVPSPYKLLQQPSCMATPPTTIALSLCSSVFVLVLSISGVCLNHLVDLLIRPHTPPGMAQSSPVLFAPIQLAATTSTTELPPLSSLQLLETTRE